MLMAALVVTCCTPRSKYERRLRQELNSGVRNDSLFMGIYLGMTDRDFYTHCWELNRQGLVRQGSGNMTVEYMMREELEYPAKMDFYPKFADGKIVEMPVRYAYTGWAPWNNRLSSDSLQVEILDWYRNIYGDGFIVVQHPERGSAYTKIDGNRRITVFKQNELYVWAVFTDMSAAEPGDGKPDPLPAETKGSGG